MSFTVFVCSTFSDLAPEREKVLDAIRGVKAKHESMEFFGARTEQPIEICLQEVRASHALIVIVSHLYGSIVPGREISFSEAEYEQAVSLRKPCLVYMRDDNVPILRKHVETDPKKLKLLERWKETLQAQHTVARFQDGDGLAVQVATDLTRTMQDLEDVEKARAAAGTGDSTALFAEVKHIISDALAGGVSEASLLSAIRSSVSSLPATPPKRAPTAPKRGPTAFLSYARVDVDDVEPVAQGLVNGGIQLLSASTSDTESGLDWVHGIERSLASADAIVVFISPNYMNSEMAKRELQFALHHHVYGGGISNIHKVILQHHDRFELPPLLQDLVGYDLRRGDVKDTIDSLVVNIHRQFDEAARLNR